MPNWWMLHPWWGVGVWVGRPGGFIKEKRSPYPMWASWPVMDLLGFALASLKVEMGQWGFCQNDPSYPLVAYPFPVISPFSPSSSSYLPISIFPIFLHPCIVSYNSFTTEDRKVKASLLALPTACQLVHCLRIFYDRLRRQSALSEKPRCQCRS